MAKKKKELWERQPWDTDASFRYFHKYYLAQIAPRSLSKAYRNMRLDKGIKEGKQKTAPGAWQKWAAGKNYKEKKIKGSVTWASRADAFDDYCALNDIDQWIERRNTVREDDWSLGEGLRKLATSILDEGPGFLVQKRKTIKGTGGDPDKMIITLALDINSAVKAGGLASKLQRLAAEMPTEHKIEEVTHKGYVNFSPDEWDQAES